MEKNQLSHPIPSRGAATYLVGAYDVLVRDCTHQDSLHLSHALLARLPFLLIGLLRVVVPLIAGGAGQRQT